MFIDLPHTATFFGFNPIAGQAPIVPQQPEPTHSPTNDPVTPQPECEELPFTAHEYMLGLGKARLPHRLFTHHPGPLGLPYFCKPRQNPLYTTSAGHMAERIRQAKANGKKIIVFLGCGASALEVFAAAKRDSNAFVVGIDDRSCDWFYQPDKPFSIPKQAFNPSDTSINILLANGRWQQILQDAPQASIDEFWCLCPVGCPGDNASYSIFSAPTSPSQLAHLLAPNGTINILTENEPVPVSWSRYSDFDNSGLVMTHTGQIKRNADIDHEYYITYSPQFARWRCDRPTYLLQIRHKTR